jgi:hypothetical protein
MKYVIETELREFISRLPDISIEPLTAHLVMLAVRSRLAREILGYKIRDLVIERRIVRPTPNWRDRYFDKVYNLAVLQREGKYHYKEDLIPPESRAIYATLSPRNVRRAIAEIMKRNVDELYKNDESSKLVLAKQDTLFFSMLHKHKNRGTSFVTLDLDVLDKNILLDIQETIESKGIPIFMITETSRGYHVVLDLSRPEHSRLFYGEGSLVTSIMSRYFTSGLEILRDSQEPIPGTRYYRKGKEDTYVRIIL